MHDKKIFTSPLTSQPVDANRKFNLWETVKGPYLSRGIFDKQAINKSAQLWFVMHPVLWKVVTAIFLLICFIYLIRD
jgi:hypothetical protein